jgi:hypothetical protein
MQLDSMTQQNSALVEEASAASESMADQARGLAEMMDKYNVSDEVMPARTAVAVDSRGSTVQPKPLERRSAGRPWAKADSNAHPAKSFTPRAPVGRTQPNVGAASGAESEWEQF